jgi:hypothetical protein
LNLKQDSAEPYTACPYFLTKITEAKIEANEKPNKNQPEPFLDEEKPDRNKEKPPACRHHFGYLRKRAKFMMNASFARTLLNACLEK